MTRFGIQYLLLIYSEKIYTNREMFVNELNKNKIIALLDKIKVRELAKN